MSEDLAIHSVWLIAVLVFMIAALMSHRPRIRTVLRSLVAWALIGFVAYVVVANRHELGGIFARIGANVGLSEQQVQGETVRIRMSPDGHFWADASLNGVRRRMLVDSGATVTAISEATAEAAGVPIDRNGFPVILGTGNGQVVANRGRVAELSVGPLTTSDLGVVVAPNFGDLDVLGMNFLSRLGSWRVEGNVLILEPARDGTGGDTGAGAGTSADPSI